MPDLDAIRTEKTFRVFQGAVFKEDALKPFTRNSIVPHCSKPNR